MQAKAEFIWLNGELKRWDDARVHVLAHALHYGTGVFEGIRSYETARGPAVFRLDDHLRRLQASAALYEIEIPYTLADLRTATIEIVRRNKLTHAYIRPLVFVDACTLNLSPRGCPVSVAIAGMPTGAYMPGGLERGVRVTVSPVRRFDGAAIPTEGKASGQYVNSVRAVLEATARGFDEALLLNSRGEVAEGAGENLFIVKGGTLTTNGADAAILMGLTRESVLTIAADLGIETAIRPIKVGDLEDADELFFSGTAVEITPIREVDGIMVGTGRPGPITQRIQRTFFEAVRGERPEYERWLTYVREA